MSESAMCTNPKIAARGLTLAGPNDTRASRRLDPRASLLVLLLANVQMGLSSSVCSELAVLLICAACYLYCGRVASLARWVSFYALFALAGFAFLLVDTPFSSPFAASFLVYRHAVPLFMFAANMVATTRAGELACALQRLNFPSKLIVALCIAFRFLPTIGREFKAVSEAMKTRGIALSPSSVARHPVWTVERLLVPVIARLGTVADELGNAVVVRGVETQRRRTSYYSLKLNAFDVAVSAFSFAAVVCAAISRTGIAPWV